MKTYQITLSSVDLPYVLEAIGLRAPVLRPEQALLIELQEI